MRGKKCIIILFQTILLLSTFPTIQSDFATAYETTTAENTNEAFVLNSTYPTIKILDSSSGAPRPVSSIEALKYNTEKKLIFYINDEPQYDEAGYPVQEKTAKILISKDQLIDYFGDISDIALNYAFKVYNETTWEIDVPDITNTEIIIKKFTEPELGTKWFTRGSNSSIRFGTRPMYIEIASIDDRGFNLSISHPVCNDGQTVYINETWLSSKNITNPYFEWGEGRPWMPLEYNYTNGTYVLQPKHFSYIGIHEAATGQFNAWLVKKSKKTEAYLNPLFYKKLELPDDDVITSAKLTRVSDTTFVVAYKRSDEDATKIFARPFKIQFEDGTSSFKYGQFHFIVGQEKEVFNLNNVSSSVGHPSSTNLLDVLSPWGNDHIFSIVSGKKWWASPYDKILYGYSVCKVTDDLTITIVSRDNKLISARYETCYLGMYNGFETKDYTGVTYSKQTYSDGDPHEYSYLVYKAFTSTGTAITRSGQLGSFVDGDNEESFSLDPETNIVHVNYYNVNNENDREGVLKITDSGWSVLADDEDVPSRIHYTAVSINFIYPYYIYQSWTGGGSSHTKIWKYDTGQHKYILLKQTDGIRVTGRAIYDPDYSQFHRKVISIGSGNVKIYTISTSGSIQVTDQGSSYDYDSLVWEFINRDNMIWLIQDDANWYIVPVHIGGAGTVTAQRNAGTLSETNQYTINAHLSATDKVLVAPVSSSVNSITSVKIGSTPCTAVSSFNNLGPYKYFYNAGEQIVYVYLGSTNSATVTIQASYGASFELTFPRYLRVGDYIMARGLIKNADGIPISGTVATTTIYTEGGQPIISVGWNCTGGNYQTAISTTELVPGVYDIIVRFEDIGSGATFEYGTTLYLGVPISGSSGEDIYASAYLYYTVFDQNTGAKLEDDFYKFYISSDTSIDEYDRVIGGKYPVVLGQTYYIQIRDYWNNKIYPTDADYDEVFIDRAEFYYDVGIPFNQFLIKNSNDSVVYFRMTNGPLDGATNTWYARWIPPYESAEIFVRTGMYNISIQYYDPSDPTHLLKTVNITNLYIDTDYFYWIPGYKIGDIIIAVWNTNSSILNQIINVGVYVKNMNSSIINQIVNSTYLVENINTSIRYQTSVIQMMLNNTESNITNQINVMQQEIDNHLTNITNQVNHMWQSVNNTNTSIINQLNAVWQEVNNTNTTLVNQVNMIMQHIINHLNLQSTRTMLPGTIRYWTFDNESFKDSKGNDPIATNNVSFSNEGKYGGAAQFSGEESYICAANGFNLSNGTVEIWIKADFGNEKDRGIVNKSEVFSIEYNATDQKLIGAVAKDGQAFTKEEYNSKDDIVGSVSAQNKIYVAQSFTVGTVGSPGPYTIGKVRLMAARVGSPGIVYCNITHTDANGKPTGDPIATSYLDANNWAEYVDDNSYQWVTFNMTPAVLEPGIKYAIVISQPNQTNGHVKLPYTYKGYSGGCIVCKSSTSTSFLLSNDLRFEVYSVGRLHVETAFDPDDQWHHIVLTWQRLWNDTNSNWDTLLRMYVDGTLVDQSETSSELTFNSTEPLYIGCTDINHSWKGLLDELFIYNRALTSDEAYYRYAGFSPMTQWNVILQDIDNANASIRTQINHLSQIVNNTNASIHIQLNAIEQLINNTNSTIHSQLNIIVQKVDNANASIHAQLNIINQEIQNLNSTIEYQYNALSQKIVNFEANITGQINSVWLEVNNTNTSIHQQLNLISADIYNMNASIHTQINALSTQIQNMESNITDQTNLIAIKIDNMESNITNQINGVNITIMNHNTSVMNQLNAILSQIINSNTSIIDQVNLIWNAVNNTNSTIHMQMNAIQNDINNANSTIHTQLNVISTQITNTESNITEQLNTINIKISNTETNITNQINSVNMTIINHNTSVMDQLNAILSQIVNTNTSIIDQVNLIWNAVNNTNSTIHMQMNAIQNDINNANSTIHTQLNVISTQIINTESNITEQLNNINIKISNTESNITNQLNSVNITITNHNTSVMNQLNAILSQIINSNTSIIDQVNLIWNAVNNTNSTIHMQMNAIQNDINNANSTIHTQLNVISTQITNTESNITEQLNIINIKISNTESNITNQINGVNITITNHNTSVMNQINAIMNTIVNTNATIIDQINLIWNAVNNTNSSIQTQINGVHTTITTFWSDVNYSFTVIQSDISYHNTTIVNLINDMNASLYAQLVNVLDNVSESGESVFDKTMEILEKMGNLTGNLTLNDRLINILDNISDARVQILNKTIDILDKMGNLSSNTTLNDRLLSILDNISETRIQILNKTLDILSKMGNLSSNNTLNDKLLDILDNISDTRIQILNKTLDILALLGDKINNQTISDALWDVLENITTMQQQMAQNFSYIEQVNVNLTNETLEMLDQIYNALLDVNATAMKDLYTLLEDVLRQFKLPHEWRLPQVNYTLEDKTPPVTTISAEITINSEIRVTWSSVDNVPLNVAYVDLYYKVENASYWKEWKLHQPATGTLIFRDEEPIEGKTYQFMALGTDSSGNKENQTDANTCSITYKQFVLPVSGLPTNPVQAALQDIQTILLVVALIILALIALLIYMRRERQNA